MKITLTSIFVNNPLEAHLFYTQVLGFLTLRLIPDANLAIVAGWNRAPAGTE